MVTSIMKLDVAPRKHLIIISIAAVAWLLINIIIGGAGPSEIDTFVWYAYNCENESHNWNPNDCSGVQMNQNTSWWIQDLPDMEPLNRFWSIEAFPFTNLQENTQFEDGVEFQVSVFGRNDKESNVWYLVAENQTRYESFTCSEANEPCTGFVLIDEEYIKYTYYQVQVRLPRNEESYLIGDVAFRLNFGHAGYSKIEIGFRVVYMILSFCVMFFYFYTMKKIPLIDWAWEQRALALLLLGVLCFNNIFAPFRFAVRGWFFPFMSSLIEVAFYCILLMFWLLMIDRIRREELAPENNKRHYYKAAAVGVFGLLALIWFAWSSIVAESDPVYGTSVTGVVALYYIVAIYWTALLLWVIILGIMTVPVVTTKGSTFQRFLYFAVPTSIVILSILIAVFSGSVGPVKRNSLSFLYFAALFNVYSWVLVYGYLPGRANYAQLSNNEEAPLYYNFGSTTTTTSDNL